MQVVAPSSLLIRRAGDVLLAATLVFLLGVGLLVLGLALHVVSLAVPDNPGYALYDAARKAMLPLGIVLALLGMALSLRALPGRVDNRNARQLAALLAPQLDQRYIFMHSIQRRRLGSIDAALLSPHGLLLLRITRRKGRYFNVGQQWLRGRDKSWRVLHWSPSRELLQQSRRLQAQLAGCGLADVPIFAAVIFMHDAPAVQLRSQEPAVPSLHASDFLQGLGAGYFSQIRLAQATVVALARYLCG